MGRRRNACIFRRGVWDFYFYLLSFYMTFLLLFTSYISKRYGGGVWYDTSMILVLEAQAHES